MVLRCLSGALLAILLLGSPLMASAQGRNDPSTMKSYSAPGATAPRSSLPVLPPVVIVPRDRTVIQSYYRGHGGPGQGRAGHCPPGQAKKGNCAPGSPAYRVAPNSHLPAGMSVAPLPRPLLERLTLAPPGYSYGYLDGSVVLYATGSRLIADTAPAY